MHLLPSYQNIRMDQQYYYLSQSIARGASHSISKFNLEGTPMILIANDSSIQLYEIRDDGLLFSRRFSFCCSIANIKVIPDQHQLTDYLFILDGRGRHGFWHPIAGFLHIQNTIANNPEYEHLYKMKGELSEEIPFCSQIHHFDVLDTKGSVMFSLKHQLHLLNYVVKYDGFKVENVKTIQLGLISCRYLGWVESAKQRLLGIIQQKQEKTFFKIYPISKLTQIKTANSTFQCQILNLLQFKSISKKQIILLSNQQITIISINPYEIRAKYAINQSIGKLVVFNPQLYGYIGQEVVLVNGIQMKSYGSLQYQNKNILEGKSIEEVEFLHQCTDGSQLVSIVTSSSEVLFIKLYQNTWRLYYKLAFLGPIFSLHPTHNPNCLLAVTNTADQVFTVNILQKQKLMPLSRQQNHPSLIQKVVTFKGGQFLLLVGKQKLTLLGYKEMSGSYEDYQFQLGHIQGQYLAANDFFVVTSKSINTWNLQSKICQLFSQKEVILVQLKNNYAVYMTENQQIWQIELDQQTTSTKIIREGSITEYLWAILSDKTLIVADSSNLFQLSQFQGSTLIRTVDLPVSGIINSIIQFNSLLVLGYVDGIVRILDTHFEVVHSFQGYATELVSFFKMEESKLGVLSGNKVFLLEVNPEYKMQLLRLSPEHKQIRNVVYSQRTSQLLFVQATSNQSRIRGVSLSKLNDKISTYEYRITELCQYSQEIPIVHSQKEFIYIALKQSLRIYQWTNLKLIKQIPNYLSDVIGIQPLNQGLVVYGIDQLSRNILIVITKEHQVAASVNLILNDNKYVKTIKTILGRENNAFICRGEKYATEYQLTDTFEINQIKETRADFQGYSLEIQQEYSLFAVTDSFRFLALYTFNQYIVAVARFVGHSQINDHVLLSRATLFGDKSGFLSILEYNFQHPQQPLRQIMTKVGSARVGQQVTTINKINGRKALYGTMEGKLGAVSLLSEEEFDILRKIEDQMIQRLQEQQTFNYKNWRLRQVQDKMIDGALIRKYLQSDPEIVEGKELLLQEVSIIYQKLQK